MRTLLFTLEYPPFHGGVANYYGNLVKYWPASARAADKPKPERIIVLNNNHGELSKGRWTLNWLKAAVKLRQAIKIKSINHVLVGQILPLGTAALVCSWFCKIKYSVILHGLDFTGAMKSGRKKIVSKMILAKADKIICANTYMAKLVSQTFPTVTRKIVIVNPGVENLLTRNSQLATRLKERYSLRNKIILLSVGRLVKRKGFDKVIEAMPATLKQAPNLIYVIIGDGEERTNLKFKILNLKLENNVLMINQAADEERDSWYELCHMFIMPARNINGDFEGFGIVYLEANLAGKPVIAGLSGGVGDAVIDGLNGLLVEPESVNDISEKVIKLALNPELRRKLGEQGRERVLREFNWQKQAEKIYKVIKPL